MICLSRRGFILVMILAFLTILLLVSWAIIGLGAGELLQTKGRNDFASAYYIASAGAEKMYATLKSMSTVTWGQTITGAISQAGSPVGNFSASANTISPDEFCIVSDGTVNGRRARAVVKYGFRSNFTGGVPLGSIGPMSLTGASQAANLLIDGPALSNSTISILGYTTVTNGVFPSQTLPIPTFWCDADMNPKIVFDTNDDGDYAQDTDHDGVVTLSEAVAQDKEAAFALDNSYTRDNGNADQAQNDAYRINEKDAFFYYYTHDLNNKYNLGIAPGEPNYYSSGRTFDPGDVATNVRVVFVDGDVSVNKNDQNWNGNVALNHTLASTGSINLVQPTNRPGDRLAIIAYNNVYMTGEMGNQGGTIGDLIIYAHNDFTAENGGKINASIFAKGTVTINTIGDDRGKDHRLLFKSTIDWSSPPIGLPKDYAVISIDFAIENDSSYKSVWQRN